MAAIKGENGEFITNDHDKAEKLNSFFSSVFTSDNNILPDSLVGPVKDDSNNNDNIIDDINFSVDNVLDN